MHEFLSDLNLMPFHLSLVVLLLLSTVETIGYYFNFRPSQLLKNVFSQRITESPLLDVKFSKVLDFCFFTDEFQCCRIFFTVLRFTHNNNILFLLITLFFQRLLLPSFLQSS